MRKKFKAAAAAAMVFLLIFSSCGTKSPAQPDVSSEAAEAEDSETEDKYEELKEELRAVPHDPPRDNDLLYKDDDPGSVVTMYLTVSRGNEYENTDHSWEEINKYSAYDYEKMKVTRYKIQGLLQVGDEDGPTEGMVGYGESIPNAEVQIRGQISTQEAQKGFKIELKDGMGSWRGQTTINLNKHPGDYTRIRNKLCYDLLKDIPELLGARTQFVNLYVKDLSGGEENAEFVDYGLFTHVEQMNRAYLRARGLDEDGQMYKNNSFEFTDFDNRIHTVGDPEYNEKRFEEVLESKGNDDHSKFIEMLADLNNLSLPIEEVFEKWFDEENFFNWLAFNILVGNADTINRNTFLYSPREQNTWYLISWDIDAAFRKNEERLRGNYDEGSTHVGVGNYWGNTLYQRVLKSEHYREVLDEKINYLRGILTEEKIRSLIDIYNPAAEKYIYQEPDIEYMRRTKEERRRILDAIPGEVELNYQLYAENLKAPMPFYMSIGTDEYEDEVVWDAAFDFDGEAVTYTVEIARDLYFEDVIFEESGIIIPRIKLPALETGDYCIRVTAVNESGYSQRAMETVITVSGMHYGIREFGVDRDGSIWEKASEED